MCWWFSRFYGQASGFLGASLGARWSRIVPANAGDTGSIPGLGRPEKEMAAHSSILAWKIPWTEEPGELQPTGLQRAGHDMT